MYWNFDMFLSGDIFLEHRWLVTYLFHMNLLRLMLYCEYIICE